MAVCNRKCAECTYKDCIDDTFTPSDYLDLIDLEKSLGVYLPEDEKFFYDDLLAVVERQREREYKTSWQRNKRFQERCIQDG